MIAVVDGAAKPGLRPAEEGQSDVAATNHDFDATSTAIAEFAGTLTCTAPPAVTISALPAHPEGPSPPVNTSQYVPAASPVDNVAVNGCPS